MTARGWAESNGDKLMMIRTEQEAADILKISVRTLQRWRREGQGPSYTRLGVRRLGYSDDDLQAWLRRNSFKSRAAELSKQAA